MTRPSALLKDDGTHSSYDPSLCRCNLTIDDGHSQKVATMAGAGIAPNSLWSVHNELASGQLVLVLPGYTCVAETALWLIYPYTNILSAKVRVFMDFLLERIGKSPVWEAYGDKPVEMRKRSYVSCIATGHLGLRAHVSAKADLHSDFGMTFVAGPKRPVSKEQTLHRSID